MTSRPSDRTPARVVKPVDYSVPTPRHGNRLKRSNMVPMVKEVAAAIAALRFPHGSTIILNRNDDGRWWVSEHAIVPAAVMVTHLLPMKHTGDAPKYAHAARELLVKLRQAIAQKIAREVAEE